MSISKNGIKRKREYLFEMFQQEWTCPISSYPILQPVVTSDGHTYEKSEINQWLKNKKTSPKTGLRLPTLKILPNLALKSVISKFNKQIKYEIDKIVQENKDYQIKMVQFEQRVKNISDQLKSEKEKNKKLKKIIDEFEKQKRETLKETRQIGTQTETETETKVLRRQRQEMVKIQKEQGKSTMGVKYQQSDEGQYVQQQSGQTSEDDEQQLSQQTSQQQNSQKSQQNSSISQQQNSESQKQQNSESQKESNNSRYKHSNNFRQKYRYQQKQNNQVQSQQQNNNYDSNKHKLIKLEENIRQKQRQLLNKFMKRCDQKLQVLYQKSSQKQQPSLNKKITLLPFNSYLMNHAVLYHQKQYQLDHSGIKINLTQFFNHDWSQLKLLNLNSCHLTSKTFKRLAQGLSKGCKNLKTLNLADNKIVKVTRKTMNKLKYLKRISFADKIQGKMCKSQLNQKSKTMLAKFDKDMVEFDSLMNKKNGFRCQKQLIRQNQQIKLREQREEQQY